ncbi:hypothetical protein [Streptomyces sp. PT12]|uniref:hypothetical protein n=1 Tax=Streptomyces sp. PT12 TaxID=1510197 RepID=UPI000DE20103|nr:hypothetical protein [Streptomyces sp. PT12]RBM20256.1 hypothetical protein DEH69_09010 [Streptomyces sp. PT12]
MSMPGGSNPYQQPQPYGAPPASYGYPQGPGGFGPMVPPGPPPRGGGRSAVWVAGFAGALLASAAWGGVVVATGGLGSGEEDADLAGYRFARDMCETGDMTAFEEDYQPYADSEPRPQSARSDDLDLSSCEFSLEPRGADPSGYETAYMTYEITWHKATDPEGEFAAAAESYDQYNEFDGFYEYRTEPLESLGEEAFIVYGDDASTGELSWVSLMVRDGWFEYGLTWNAFLTEPDNEHLTEPDRVRDMLVAATEETLATLQRPADEADTPGDSV